MPDLFKAFKNFHPVKSFLQKRGLNQYLSSHGTGHHYGRFNSFSEARAWLPPSKEFHYSDFAQEYIDERSNRIYSFDYPVLFWLHDAFLEGCTSVLDIGGSIGNQYYAYSKYIQYPSSLSWQVHELPAFVKIGRELAQARQSPHLSFTDELDPDEIDATIWIAAGAIEFIETLRLDDLLKRAKKRPKHIFLNKLPLYDGPQCVSTQNIGNGSFSPHYVFNRQDYIAGIEQVGYRLADHWAVPDRKFLVPGQPENSFDEYSGLYFVAL
jgi:putative methyltransferase (TIGR04325 family)